MDDTQALDQNRSEAVTERVVIVTGSRLWADEAPIHAALDEAKPTLVVHGNARGADQIARDWATMHGVKVRAFYANWLKYTGSAPGRCATA